MTVRTVPRALTALLSMTLLTACSGPASNDQDKLPTPTTPPPVVKEEPTVAHVNDNVPLPVDPAPIDSFRGVDVYRFEDVYPSAALVDTTGWQPLNFGNYVVDVPAHWTIYPSGDSRKVDEVFAGIYQDSVHAVATGGAVKDLDSLIEHNTDGFVIVTSTRLTEVELGIYANQGLSPSRLPIATAGREPDQLLVKDGIDPWINYVKRLSTPRDNSGYVEQRHIRFYDAKGHGFEISVIDKDANVVDTVIASFRSP
ncbi:hypothetical protein SAMN06309944_0721 [Micrococcales bacterium KH10]|nr:hypothetical protein SAMN06309944_0721 [Micrococcales bacterium KH10]